MAENVAVLDFELSEKEMDEIKAFDLKRLLFNFCHDPVAVERYMELEKLGLIYPVKGRGNFVADSSQVQKINRDNYRKEFAALIEKGRNTGFSQRELEKMLAENFETEEKS